MFSSTFTNYKIRNPIIRSNTISMVDYFSFS